MNDISRKQAKISESKYFLMINKYENVILNTEVLKLREYMEGYDKVIGI